MNARLFGIALAAMSVLLPGVAHAGHFGMEVIERIDIIPGIPATPPGNGYEDLFLTEVAPGHRKRLDYGAAFTNTQSTEPTSITLWLMWGFSGLPAQTTVPETIDLAAGEIRVFGTSHIIPFTPPLVGIHLQNNGPGGPVGVLGGLSHQTVPIPEPGSIILALFALAGPIVLARRRGRMAQARSLVTPLTASAGSPAWSAPPRAGPAS